jgi:hypothetical protein
MKTQELGGHYPKLDQVLEVSPNNPLPSPYGHSLGESAVLSFTSQVYIQFNRDRYQCKAANCGVNLIRIVFETTGCYSCFTSLTQVYVSVQPCSCSMSRK